MADKLHKVIKELRPSIYGIFLSSIVYLLLLTLMSGSLEFTDYFTWLGFGGLILGFIWFLMNIIFSMCFTFWQTRRSLFNSKRIFLIGRNGLIAISLSIPVFILICILYFILSFIIPGPIGLAI